jgi:hypothetical protein
MHASRLRKGQGFFNGGVGVVVVWELSAKGRVWLRNQDLLEEVGSVGLRFCVYNCSCGGGVHV